jgi:hypothetical protein
MSGGEGGIRTLGTLLGYGALAKRCFRPLSHLTKLRAGVALSRTGTRADNMLRNQALPMPQFASGRGEKITAGRQAESSDSCP